MLGIQSPKFRIQPLSAGVWAAIGNRAEGVSSNAGIADLGDVTLVIDAFPSLRAAQDLRTAARVLTGRDPSALVNTHWHFDHCLGNSVFRDCEVYSTQATRDRMVEQGARFISTLRADYIARQVSALDEAQRRESRAGFREELESELAAARELANEWRSVVVQAPNQVHSPKFNLPSLRSAWFIELRGHTESDTAVFIPAAETLFAGDLVTPETHPNLASGNIDEWERSLAGIEKIAPGTIVPGHGPVTDVGDCGVLRDYFEELRQLAEGEQPVEIPLAYQEWKSPSLFSANIRSLSVRSP